MWFIRLVLVYILGLIGFITYIMSISSVDKLQAGSLYIASITSFITAFITGFKKLEDKVISKTEEILEDKSEDVDISDTTDISN